MNPIAEMCAKRIKDIALDLEKTGRLCCLLNIKPLKSQGDQQERSDMVAANRSLQISLEESLHELASMVSECYGQPISKSRQDFEQWYEQYVRDPIDSQLPWKAWMAARSVK